MKENEILDELERRIVSALERVNAGAQSIEQAADELGLKATACGWYVVPRWGWIIKYEREISRWVYYY